MKLKEAVRLEQLAAWTGGKAIGDPGHLITGINEIHCVEKGDITFVDQPKYYDKVLRSAATTIIINKEVEAPEGKALIFHDDPFTAYVNLVLRFRSFEPSPVMVSPKAVIGEGSHIQPGAFIGNNVTIGKNCLIHANVSIYDHSIIGDNVIIHSGSVIGADGFYFKKRDNRIDKLESCGRVIIGDNVEIGACCTIDKGVSGDTCIGEYTKLDNHIQIGHDTVVGKRCILASHVAIAGVTVIEDDVILWGQVAIQKDIVIGAGAVVLAKSGVDKSIAGNKVYFGIPVQEARAAWKEKAMMRQLPEILERLKALEKER